MTDRVECVIVGAGVVGLAIARALAHAGREVMILEAADTFGTGISSRNSEVIHAGIYYPEGSLKARLCVRGRQLLYRYCADRAVPHHAIGKLIVATTDEQRGRLAVLADAAVTNGVTELRELGADEVHALEPEITAVAGLLSPSTGIVDAAALMRSLLTDATGSGAEIAYRSRITGARRRGAGVQPAGLEIDVAGVGSLTCDWLINAAGLGSW
ncbi:MAG: FAD-dependent oxidoreductase, partial [Gordonia amarae]